MHMVRDRHFFGPHMLLKMSLNSIFSLVATAGDMLVGAHSQIMAAGHVKCIKLTTIVYNSSNYLPGCFEHAHCAWPTIILASYILKVSLKSLFNLISAAGDMLTGVQSQIMAAGHVKCIKLTTFA
jgi:hypothetical protein